MANLENARCPECGKTAHGRDKVKALFGIRINHGHEMVQSWCKKCRSK